MPIPSAMFLMEAGRAVVDSTAPPISPTNSPFTRAYRGMQSTDEVAENWR
ncbi:MAG: hypothetical protein VYA84_21575 [Planctomycetota bacterium]|nr:hypothetical protein [Planctomycetota bacterium]